ncbi:putative steroid-binding protein 3, partial [Tetrabaena socialis]
VVPPRELTAAELALHDGSDPALPLLLSIKGTVYDITKGKEYYGPDGIYPFAGKEVARAFALFSTDLAECNDNLEGLSYTEAESLRDWIGKFNSKYPIVGKLVGSK